MHSWSWCNFKKGRYILIESEIKSIPYFSQHEIERTGATLASVQYSTIRTLNTLREVEARRIFLVHNGLTTGEHKSKEHPLGLAVDFCFYKEDGIVNPISVFKNILTVGFKGVGMYWNGNQYSFHCDLRPHYAFWNGIKKSKTQGWTFKSAIVDPRYIQL